MKRSSLYKIIGGVVVLVVLIIVIVSVSGGGSSTATLSATSTCADWNADASGGDQADINTFVTNATGSADPAIISYVTRQCAADGGLNLSGVMSAASLNASLGG